MYVPTYCTFAVILSECSERIGASSRAPADVVSGSIVGAELPLVHCHVVFVIRPPDYAPML